jgi:serine/threonine protein kinase/response regulator RpfG family c-di-GMP phosphodiesterase
MNSQPSRPDATSIDFPQAVAASGLVNADAFREAEEAARGDAKALAESLVAKQLLTRFQVDALLEGRGDTLTLGNYEILDRLGAGGMGTVYKARHRRMKRIVALKILAANLSENPVFLKRFQREVETIACLGHPNIVMAYDADATGSTHFLVMEFVHGMDLAAFVARQGPLPVAEAVDCLLQAARGLAYAHSQEMVHRDVKPHNLLRDESGVVKLTDLGLVQLNRDVEDKAVDTGMTSIGGIVGTPDYMPPEQGLDSAALDHRADIYALGCTLCFLLTGRAPYTGGNVLSILLKHRDAPIPDLEPAPPRLNALFRRMVAKRPDDRVQRMEEVVRELEAITAELAAGNVGAGTSPSTVDPDLRLGAAASGPTPAVSQWSSASTPRHADQTQDFGVTELKMTALIVEPSRVQAAIIRGFLQEHGVEVLATASRGEDAIELVRRHQPNAVVSAMQLPDFTGVRLAERIRSECDMVAPGFVLVTTGASDGESQGFVHLPRVVSLCKPFSSQQLWQSLGRVTGTSQEFTLAGVPAPGGNPTLVLTPAEFAAAAGCPPRATPAASFPATSPAATSPSATSLPADGAAAMGPTAGAGQAVAATGNLAGKIDRARLRVMIVDDSATARMNIRNVLKGLGISNFLEVPDGAYAIAVAANEICHLIVTDYNMPLMDGRALVSYLKQNPATRHIPIVMVTTEADPAKLAAVRRLGVVAILEKAFPAQIVGPLLDSLF